MPILALFGGVLIGTFIGAIPGMTVTMGVALTLPFTFTMAPVTSILLLIGVYKGGIYGGSITAILIKTPGTAAASCTVLDGYLMSQKGQARKALDIALYASCFADFVSKHIAHFIRRVFSIVRIAFRSARVFHADRVFADHHCRYIWRQHGQRYGLRWAWSIARDGGIGLGLRYQSIRVR